MFVGSSMLETRRLLRVWLLAALLVGAVVTNGCSDEGDPGGEEVAESATAVSGPKRFVNPSIERQT